MPIRPHIAHGGHSTRASTSTSTKTKARTRTSSRTSSSPQPSRPYTAMVIPPSAPCTSTDEIGFKSEMLPKGTSPVRASAKDRGPCARVELMLAAKALADRDVFSKSDPICVVEEYVPRGAPGNIQHVYTEIGRTERIKNSLNPKWNKRIALDYFFESKQLLRFNLYDIDCESDELTEHDFLGRAECELADIVAAPNGTYEMRVLYSRDVPNQSGKLIVCAEELDEGQRESVYFVCRGISLKPGSFLRTCFLEPNAFLEFYRLHSDGSKQMVHRTEVVESSKSPEWKPFEITVKRLCEGGDKKKEFLIECYDRREATGNHHLFGSAQTSVSALVEGQKQRQIDLIKAKRGVKKEPKLRGILHFLDVQVRKEFTFLDFITSGMQLEFAVAVDLTASNGEVTKSSSLHYVNSQYLNQYECAICAVLEICEHYNQSKQFEALGFGAKIPPAFSVSHMFPLRLNNFERTVEGIQGVLDAYRYAVVNTQLYGPTNFAPTIKEFVHKCRQFPRDGSKYQVLLILTDGIITDMQKTMEAIIEASHQPISIIIVGIGNEDFKKMEFLDSDNRLLTHNGKTAARDIVQFVPFREFTGSAWGTTPAEQAQLKTVLAREVLAELPAQVCSFMKAHSISPKRPNGTTNPTDTVATFPPHIPPLTTPTILPSTTVTRSSPRNSFNAGRPTRPSSAMGVHDAHQRHSVGLPHQQQSLRRSSGYSAGPPYPER